ncbi:MAG TPA: HAD-IA family hydrolase [Caulobacteraceae bacterium]|nr:HAD-IA family hydrolase [Caulobacteraceae bacterium]
MSRAVLFDLGGVLLPFDPERRVRAIAAATGAAPDAIRSLFAGDLPGRMDLGEADERDYAAAFSGLAGRTVDPEEAIDLILSVFEAPNAALWSLAARLAEQIRVGGFSDNPPFVRRVFPTGAWLEPMLFSAQIGACKPSAAAFAAAEAALGLSPDAIVFVDDSPANVAAALARGWDALHFTGEGALMAALAARGLL